MSHDPTNGIIDYTDEQPCVLVLQSDIRNLIQVTIRRHPVGFKIQIVAKHWACEFS